MIVKCHSIHAFRYNLFSSQVMSAHTLIIVPNSGAVTFINFDEKLRDLPTARPLFYSILLMPALLFGTFEYFKIRLSYWSIFKSGFIFTS